MIRVLALYDTQYSLVSKTLDLFIYGGVLMGKCLNMHLVGES